MLADAATSGRLDHDDGVELEALGLGRRDQRDRRGEGLAGRQPGGDDGRRAAPPGRSRRPRCARRPAPSPAATTAAGQRRRCGDDLGRSPRGPRRAGRAPRRRRRGGAAGWPGRGSARGRGSRRRARRTGRASGEPSTCHHVVPARLAGRAPSTGPGRRARSSTGAGAAPGRACRQAMAETSWASSTTRWPKRRGRPPSTASASSISTTSAAVHGSSSARRAARRRRRRCSASVRMPSAAAASTARLVSSRRTSAGAVVAGHARSSTRRRSVLVRSAAATSSDELAGPRARRATRRSNATPQHRRPEAVARRAPRCAGRRGQSASTSFTSAAVSVRLPKRGADPRRPR